MKQKYKVGDKVKVKSLEWYNANKNVYNSIVSFVEPMAQYCGQEFIIKEVLDDGIGGYIINTPGFERDSYRWKDYMFEDSEK